MNRCLSAKWISIRLVFLTALVGGLAVVNLAGATRALAEPYANSDWAYAGYFEPVEVFVLDNDYTDPGWIDYSSVEIVSGPSGGMVSVDPQTGSVTYTPYLEFSGYDYFSYTFRDDLGAASNEAWVDVWVEDPTPPYAGDDYAYGDFTGPFTFDVTANDSGYEGELDYTSVTIEYEPLYGAVQVLSNGQVRYTPNPSEAQTDDYFMYSVRDVLGNVSNLAFVSVYLDNQAPQITLQAEYLGENLWHVWGHVSDDQPVEGLQVWISGVMSGSPTVDSAGDFSMVDFVDPYGGCVSASITDRIGATSQEAYTYVDD